jgi:hypothetical protein
VSSPFDPTILATDEDIHREAEADFRALVPRSARLAVGSDGVITTAAPWTLTSATVGFSSQSITPGQVVFVGGTPGSNAAREFGVGELSRPSGKPFIVSEVASGSITLRNPHLDDLEGDPPAWNDNLSGLIFQIYTFRSYLQSSSDWARGFLDPDVTGEFLTESEVSRIVVYDVLQRRYAILADEVSSMLPNQSGGNNDTWAAKAIYYKSARDELAKSILSRRDSGSHSPSEGYSDLNVVPTIF